MTVYRDTIELTSSAAREVIDITERVAQVVAASGMHDGVALVAARHTSCGVVMTDCDRALGDDLLDVLDRLVPLRDDYRHDTTDPKRNAAAHLQGAALGGQVLVPVAEGRLDLGPWQTIYYVELDGGRPKDLRVQVMGR